MAQIVIKRKKQGMKALIKKLVELQHVSVSAGIHKGEGKQKVKTAFGQKKKINVATLAKSLETFASWKQPKTVNIPNKDGKTYTTLHKDARMTRPARFFISFFKNTEVWNKFRSFVHKQVREFVLGRTYKPRFLMDLIGSVAVDSQKFIIMNGKTDPNSQVTIQIKGKDSPLVDSKQVLMPSLKHKVRNDRNGHSKGTKDAIKMADAEYVDKIIKQFK